MKIFNTLVIVTLNFLSGNSNILAYLSSVFMIVLLFLSMFLKMGHTAVFMPGKSCGPRSLVGYSPWGHKELDMTKQLHFTYTLC